MADLEKIKSLQEEVKMMRADLKKYYNYFKQDGSIDKEEFIYLSSMSKLIQRIEEKIKSYLTDSTTTAQENNDSSTDVKEDNSTQSTGRKGKVTASRLNVRKGPSTDFDKVDKLSNGDIVDILEEKDGWFRIGTDKWISGDYVTVEEIQENGDKKPDVPAPDTLVGNNPIKQSVGGKKATNDPADVITIKKLLNTKGSSLTVNGICDDALITAITAYQKDKMGRSKPDGKIDPGEGTWNHLNGIETYNTGYTGAKKGFKPQDQQDLDWEAETKTEEKLEQFFDDFTHLKVLINPGEPNPKYVEVVPVYEINSLKKTDPKGKPISEYGFKDTKGNIRSAISLSEYWAKFPNAGPNSKVYKIRQGLPWHAQAGKATPKDITYFLNECVKQGLVPEKDRTKLGFRKFLLQYEVGVDCTGLVSQALNFLADGNMTYEKKGDDKDEFNITSSMTHNQKFKVIGKPSAVKAGDMMKLEKGSRSYGHVRIVVDVDSMPDGSIQIRSIESGGSGENSGVGSVLWRYMNPESFDGLERSDDNGKNWKASSEHKTRQMTYQRWDKIPEYTKD